MMRILVTGGTGFIGAPLCRQLLASGAQVVVLSRSRIDAKRKLGDDVEVVEVNSVGQALPVGLVEGLDAVINLAGESIGGGRWTAARKDRILKSRMFTTRALVESINLAERRPSVLVSASAVGFYGSHGDEELSETAPAGDDFLAKVCVAWENEARRAEEIGLRVVRVRFGVVLGAHGGALAQMVTPFRFYMGGPVGSGRQWLSWVHQDDVVGIIRLAIENKAIEGPLNATAPEPMPMKEFCKAIGRVLHRPSLLPLPGFALRLILGEMADMLLNGQRVRPVRTQAFGYHFQYATADEALRSVLKKKDPRG